MVLQVLHDNKILGKFCGMENSPYGIQPILSPGNKLILVFQSDESNPEHHKNVGFSAQYQAIGRWHNSHVATPCGSVPHRH